MSRTRAVRRLGRRCATEAGRERAAPRSAGSRRGLLALIVLLGALGARPGSATAGTLRSTRVWHVDASAVAAGATGSAGAPFKTVEAALVHAQPGDEVRLRPGLYQGSVRLERTLQLSGPRSAVLVATDAQSDAVIVDAPATIVGLSIQGGAVGVRARAPLALDDVAFSAQRRAAVLVESDVTRVARGTASAAFDRGDLVGFEAAPTAALEVEEVFIEGPFRFAIRADGARLRLRGVRIEGAIGGVACVGGCEAELLDCAIAQGRGAGLVVGGGARARALRTVVSRFEQCVVANAGADLTLEDSATGFCDLTGIAAVAARLALRQHVHVGPCLTAALHLVNSEATIDGALLLAPGAAGLLAVQGRLDASALEVRGARQDRDGDFGHGALLLDAPRVRIRDARFEENEGAGLYSIRSVAGLESLLTSRNGLAGIAADERSRLEIAGLHATDNAGPGLVASGGARLRSDVGDFARNSGGAAWAKCADGSSIRLERARLARDEANALEPCVER